MDISFEVIIFYLLVIDSIGAVFVAWFGGKEWYNKHVGILARYFPATKGWTLYYLVLVLWVGTLLSRLGMLG